jgi:quercetin dioxygenase-like cupin family protein
VTKEHRFRNQLLNRVSGVVAEHDGPTWAERLIENEQVMATLISCEPGNSSRRHYHPEHDEFWIVMGGELVWEIEDQDPIHATVGDIVRVPKGAPHHITTVGDQTSLRLAIVVPDVPHVDVDTGEVF